MVAAPIGHTVSFEVRFRNGGLSRVVTIASLPGTVTAVSGASLTLGAGTCDAPSDVGLAFEARPSEVGERRVRLEFDVEGTTRPVELKLRGEGPRLAAAATVNFGPVGLAPSTLQLELLNSGTIGSAMDVVVEGVEAANAGSSANELCVGAWGGGGCEPVGALRVEGRRTVPLSLKPGSTGAKAWRLAVRSGSETRTVEVLADVIDTSDCRAFVTPSSLSFGFVPGSTVSRTATFVNEGSSPCLVLEARAADARFSTDLGRTLIAPGERRALSVFALQSGLRATSSRLELVLADRPRLAVELDGRSPPECLAVVPDRLDLGSARVECAGPSRSVTLGNRCLDSSIVVSANAEGPFRGGVSEFVLAPATTRTFPVTLAPPQTTGALLGAVVVRLDGVVVSTATLTGVGVAAPRRTDVFPFDRRWRRDWLFVIDDSPSFVSHQARARTELNEVVRRLVESTETMDVRLGVTSTDPTSGGRLRRLDGGSPWADSDDADFASTFAGLSTFSVAGAERGSCVDAAARAVSAPLADDPLANRGFRRADAALSIVCITDDVERSSDPAAQVATLRDAGVASYSVVGPIASQCPVDALDTSGTHLATTGELAGVVEDVCRSWSSSLFGLGATQTRRRSFFLGSPVHLGRIEEVALDGVSLPGNGDAGVVWRYDPASNAVRYEASWPTRDPRELSVSYVPWCLE